MNKLLKRNVSTLFLLSPLGLSHTELDSFGFIEAYIKDNQKDIYDNYYVLLLFRLSDLPADTVTQLSENKHFVEDYDYDGYVVFAYIFPEDFQEDYEHIIKGEYSKVSQGFKETFPQKVLFVPKTGKSYYANSFIHKLIFRYDYLISDLSKFFGAEITKDMEYWKAFDIDKETLNIEKVKANDEQYNTGVPG